MKYTLSDIARAFGIPISTLRYYEKENALPFLRRNDSGYFVIDEADVPTIQLLKLLMQGGLPVKQVTKVIALAEIEKHNSIGSTEVFEQIAEILRSHEDALLRKQSELLRQIEVTNYIRWEFMRYAKAGTSLIAEESYPGALPPDFQNNEMNSNPDDLLKAYCDKYGI